MHFLLALLTVSALPWTTLATAKSWSDVTDLLHAQIANHSFPGCVAAVINSDGFLYLEALGNYTYGAATPLSPAGRPMEKDTLFDLASLTKVLATTTAAMTFYQRGELDLDMLVCDDRLLGAGFANHGKEVITIRNLLMHNAGFPPDPDPEYWSREFACSSTLQPVPPETFDCRDRIYKALLQQTLENTPGEVFLYSDLSMITMMFVLGTLARDLHYISPSELLTDCAQGPEPLTQCYYESYVRKYVIELVGMPDSGFLPKESLHEKCAPTENNTYENTQIQGRVSDGNSYVLGGIAGHAGLFSSAPSIARLLHRLQFPSPSTAHWLNQTTISEWTRAQNLSQSSRALGWDTNDYTMNTYRGCADLSETTFTHTGYTGTEVCNDPVRKISTILLTNRCYPDDSSTSKEKIHRARQMFNNAVRDVVDGLLE